MTLDNCKRCPQCQLAPAVEFEAPGVWLACYKHGHRAVGDTLEKAVKHWNRYIAFVTGDAAADPLWGPHVSQG